MIRVLLQETLRHLVAPLQGVLRIVEPAKNWRPLESWIPDLAHWAIIEWRWLWVAIIVPVVVLAVAYSLGSLLLGAVLLQVGGVVCSSIGLHQTRSKFGLPLGKHLREVLRRFPSPFRPGHSVHTLSATLHIGGSRASVRGTARLATTSLEDLVKVLEQRLQRLEGEVDEVRGLCNQRAEEQQKALADERLDRLESQTRLEEKVTAIVIGGLNLELLGLLWILMGIVIASVATFSPSAVAI